MPLPSVFQDVQDSLSSVFQGVQDCRLPGLKPPKRFQPSRRPPRQQLLQLHAPAICFSGGSRLPFARPQTPQTLPTLPQASKATTLTATCPCHRFSADLQGNNSYSYMPLPSVFQGVHDKFAWPQTLQTLPQASKATTLTAIQLYTCPCHLFFRGFKTAVCPASNPPNASNPPAGLQGNNSYSYYMPLPSQTPQTLPTLPQASKATTLTAITATTCPCHLFFRGFKTAVCPASNPPNASNPPAGLQGNNSYSYMPLPSIFQGVQDCRLRQQLLQLLPSHLHAPAVCPASNPPNSPQASKATTLTATCPCHLFFRGFTTNLPGLKPSKRFRRPPRQQLVQLLHAPAICFSGGSRLPFARPQTPQTLPTLPQASKATTLTAITATTCPCHLFFRGFKTAVCPASNPPNASNPPAGLQGNNSYSYYSYYMPLPSVFQGVQDCRLPGLKPPKRFQPSRRPPRHTATTCPCHLFFRGFKTAVCPASNPPNASNPPAGLQGNNSYSYMPLPSIFQGVQDCRLRQQLLQLLHAPVICFSGGPIGSTHVSCHMCV